MPEPKRSVLSVFLFAGLLIAATIAAYWPAVHGQLLWDDNAWTTDISTLLRDSSGLWSMWSKPTALQQYYPLTGTTFWLDYQLWKFSTFPYHIENVVWHCFAVLLFWRLLERLEVPGAWLAASIFALHPIMVESVAWITERKNVVSLVFYLAALLAYGRFNSFWKDSPDLPRRWGAYVLAFVFLLAALLAKTTTFSLPAVILLISWWKHGRIQWRRDVLPSLPFFALAIAFSGITFWLETTHVGAAGPEWTIAFPQRCVIAGRAFWFYLSKLFWPQNLCFIYPRWPTEASPAWHWLFPITALGMLAALWIKRNKIGRAPAAAAFFFVGTIFPVLGFMNAYGMRYSFVWDHWVYLSSLGVIAFGAALIARLACVVSPSKAAFGFAAVLLPVLALLTWRQCGMYVNVETLWRTTIAKNPAAFLAHNNLGYILLERNQIPEAISCFENSLAINPGFSEPHNNLGDAMIRTGRTNEGMSHFKRALELAGSEPNNAVASYYNYGNAWLATGHYEEAINQYNKALEIHPGFAKARNNMGCAYLRLGRTNDALFCFQKAVEADFDLADAHNNLADMLVLGGQLSNAIDHYRKALKVRPDYRAAFYNLTRILAAQGKVNEAIQYYEEMLRADESPELHNDLGNLLVSQNRLDEAITHYQRTVAMRPDNGEFHYNLAVVLALRGRLDDAVDEFRRTSELMPESAQAHHRLALALQMQKNLPAAIAQYKKVLELDPQHGLAKNNLAWLLATCSDSSLRDGAKALELALQAKEASGGNDPSVLDTVAAAYAETGKFSEAVETATRALQLAQSQSNAVLVAGIETRLKGYQTQTPYRQRP